MNRVHELGKRSRAFGQPREVQPFLIIFVAFFFRADQSASSHPTNPVDPDLQKGVNEVREALVRVSVTRRVSRR